MRLAASRTFWTAGKSRPMRIAMIAITTNNSISVNAPRDRDRRAMTDLRGGREDEGSPHTGEMMTGLLEDTANGSCRDRTLGLLPAVGAPPPARRGVSQ